MIALSCGVHEATRRIPCPVCPRVLAELRAEVVEVQQLFTPIGKGKHRRRRSDAKADAIKLVQSGKTPREVAETLGLSIGTVKVYASGHLARYASKRVDAAEVIRRAQSGQYAAEIARALGCSDTTVWKLGKGHFVPRVKPCGRKGQRLTHEQDARLRALFARGASVSCAARLAGVGWDTARRWRNNNTGAA